MCQEEMWELMNICVIMHDIYNHRDWAQDSINGRLCSGKVCNSIRSEILVSGYNNVWQLHMANFNSNMINVQKYMDFIRKRSKSIHQLIYSRSLHNLGFLYSIHKNVSPGSTSYKKNALATGASMYCFTLNDGHVSVTLLRELTHQNRISRIMSYVLFLKRWYLKNETADALTVDADLTKCWPADSYVDIKASPAIFVVTCALDNEYVIIYKKTSNVCITIKCMALVDSVPFWAESS
jgi:hypothetical protein